MNKQTIIVALKPPFSSENTTILKNVILVYSTCNLNLLLGSIFLTLSKMGFVLN